MSDEKKKVSSSAGMQTSVETSLLLAHRATHVVPPRMVEMEKAIIAKDFQTFAKVTMQDSNSFHSTVGPPLVCPPKLYMYM